MTVDQIYSPTTNSTELKHEINDKITSQDVGLIFAREYYTFLNKKPSRLHAFYGADSLLVRGDEGESVPIFKGQEVKLSVIHNEEAQDDNVSHCRKFVTRSRNLISRIVKYW